MPTTSRRTAVLDLPLRLETATGGQARRVHAALRRAILGGQLAAGLRLPASRTLAGQLGVRRNAVVVAYEHLHGDGLVETRRGAGTYVTARLPSRAPVPEGIVAATEPAVARAPCALGRAEADPRLLRRLASAVRRRIAGAGADDLGYGDPRGSEALRAQVAAHLAASRGLLCDPGRIVVVGGVQQGLRLCAEALLAPGDAVLVEDPGYPPAHRTLAAAGLHPVPVPVDAEGLDVAAAPARPVRAAYVTPSNQFPTGVPMSMGRRLALLDWARAADAFVLEDDYDNEFRYEGPPLTALAGLDGGERVIYLGTFSKILFPALRLAYLVLPPAAVARVVAARASHDRFPPNLTEGAVADLMADGTLAAHARRTRARARAARDALAGALAQAAGDALRIVVPRQGLHLLACLPPGLPARTAARIRAEAGIEAWLLSETRLEPDPGPGATDGFVLGFAGHAVPDLVAAARRLGAAARANRPA
jgi:GntR family transcriptional regulator / MocR family aminotransferase